MLPTLRTSFPLIVAGLLSMGASIGCESSTPRAQVPLATHASLSLGSLPGRSPSVQDAASSELRQVFGEWAEARAAGDASTFEALYDVRRFEGIRWTRTGVEKRMGWTEWDADQRALLGHTGAPIRPTFESWPGGTLDAATASVSFEESTFPSLHRVLTFGRVDGKLRVVREELGGAPNRAVSARADTLSRDAKVVRLLGEK